MNPTSPIVIAGAALIATNTAKVIMGQSPDMRAVVGSFGALIFLTAMSLIAPLEPLARALAWLYLLIVFLTDGYDLLVAIGGN